MNHRRLISVGIAAARRLSTVAEEATQPKGDGGLYRRMSALGATGGSVSETVNRYLSEGKTIRTDELRSCVKKLGRDKKFHHAQELFEWMHQGSTELSYKDCAVRLNLLAKAKGIASVEEYFNSLSPYVKNNFTYGFLFNCYCKEKMLEKAIALFVQMKQLNFASTSAYNNLMNLYMRLGKPEMVPSLVKEMKEKNILPSSFSYKVLMQSYSSLNDIEGVERVMEEIKLKGREKGDWTIYSNLAAIYVDAGLFEKAELALEGLQKWMRYRERPAYHFLISLYASTSNLTEVNRVWDSLKSALPKINNSSYLIMLQALDKLDDFGEINKCFEEWELNCLRYDIRLANVIINAYLKRDLVEEATLVCEGAIKKGSGPNIRTWEMFMDFFLKKREMGLALKYMESAVSEGKDKKWHPRQETVNAFLKHFEKDKDIDGAEKFCKMLKRVNFLNSEAYHLLLLTYVGAGKTAPEMRRRMKEDEIKMNCELESLIERVCPE